MLNNCWTYVKMKIAVFQGQILKLCVVWFHFKNDVLDEGCNNKHPMPQQPGITEDVTNQPNDVLFVGKSS